MNEKNITKIITEFNSFRENLINDVKDKSKTKLIKNKECILIKEDWHNEFSKIIDKCKNNNNKEEINKEIQKFIYNKKPEIFNDIESVINCLKNLFKFNLVSFNLINIAYNNSINLNNINRAHYYTGNNKLIIEYKENEVNNAILFINPLEAIYDQEIFIFKIKNTNPDKLNFYRELLTKEEIDMTYFRGNKNIIIECNIFNNENDKSLHFKKIDTKQNNNSRQYNQYNINKNNLNKFINNSHKNKTNQTNQIIQINQSAQKINKLDKKKNYRKFYSLTTINDYSNYEKLILEKKSKNRNNSYDKKSANINKNFIQNKNNININCMKNSYFCCGPRENEKSIEMKLEREKKNINRQNEEIKNEKDENIIKITKQKKEIDIIIERKDKEIEQLKSEKVDLEKKLKLINNKQNQLNNTPNIQYINKLHEEIKKNFLLQSKVNELENKIKEKDNEIQNILYKDKTKLEKSLEENNILKVKNELKEEIKEKNKELIKIKKDLESQKLEYENILVNLKEEYKNIL